MGEKIVAVVGARLNSSRLPGKQLLPLSGRPLIHHVFERLSKVKLIDKMVLATTADDYNEELVLWAKQEGVSCYAHEGDVNDLMGRVDSVVQAQGADILVYVCGDSPLIEPSTINSLIQRLLEVPEADWCRMKELPEGESYIHEGFAIYRRSFWDRMLMTSHEAFEKEHIGSVFHVLRKVMPTQTAYAEEDPIYHSISHRVSVDTSSDYAFMKRLYDNWYATNRADTIVDLKWVIKCLQSDASLRAMNEHVHQKKVAEISKSIIIITAANKSIGLGHLKRMTVAARQLQDHMGASVKILVAGEKVQFDWLEMLPCQWFLECSIEELIADQVPEGTEYVLIDIPSVSANTLEAVETLRQRSIRCVAVDYVSDKDVFDGYYVPCFYADPDKVEALRERIASGWSSYLIERGPAFKCEVMHNTNDKLIVLTGGGDVYGLGALWPKLLDDYLPKSVDITWIQGPYAKKPDLTGISKERVFVVEFAPKGLARLVSDHDLALSVYGVSFFECLSAGLPTVTCVPQVRMETSEIKALVKENICLLSDDPQKCVKLVSSLITDTNQRTLLREKSNQLWAMEEQPPLVELLNNIQ